MKEILKRTEMLIGKDNIELLGQKKIIVFGVGGVGGNLIEALVRAGIKNITIVDFDTVDITNINRQVIALHSTIGKNKVDVMKERLLDINPEININSICDLVTTKNTKEFNLESYDYIVDAIDDVKAKIEIIKRAKELKRPIISCMGTGNKMDPSKLIIGDIHKTIACPLARVMRKEMKHLGIKKLKVLYSTELPKKLPYKQGEKNPPASISFVPAAAGLLIASKVIRDLIE